MHMVLRGGVWMPIDLQFSLLRVYLKLCHRRMNVYLLNFWITTPKMCFFIPTPKIKWRCCVSKNISWIFSIFSMLCCTAFIQYILTILLYKVVSFFVKRTADPIWFSFTLKLLIDPGRFINILGWGMVSPPIPN